MVICQINDGKAIDLLVPPSVKYTCTVKMMPEPYDDPDDDPEDGEPSGPHG